MRTAQNTKRSKSKSPGQVQKNQALIVRAHQDYLDVSSDYLNKARQTLALLEKPGRRALLILPGKPKSRASWRTPSARSRKPGGA